MLRKAYSVPNFCRRLMANVVNYDEFRELVIVQEGSRAPCYVAVNNEQFIVLA